MIWYNLCMPVDPNKAIVDLLQRAAELTGRAAELAAADDLDGAMRLEREADGLRRRARARANRRTPSGETRPRMQSAREGAVASLNELEVPSSPREIADYASARFGRTVDYRAFASIRRDERRAFDSKRSNRAVYIVPALEGRWLLPARGRFTLSEWPIEQRLIGPHSLRVDHLKVTINISAQIAWMIHRDAERAEALSELLANYARSIPGAIDDAIDVERIAAAAQAELEVLRADDDRWRAQTAQRVARLPAEQQLWGAAPPHLVEANG
jgi:hypothetical protein